MKQTTRRLLWSIASALVLCTTAMAHTFHVTTPGTLKAQVIAADNESDEGITVTELVVTGQINSTDLKYIHAASGLLVSMVTVDLSGAEIVSGGEAYYEGTYSSSNTTVYRYVYDHEYHTETVTKTSGSKKYPEITVYTDDLGYMFYYMTKLQEVHLPGGTTSVGKMAFYNCTALKTVTLPQEVEEIGERAFFNCNALATINNTGNIVRFGERAFHGCTKVDMQLNPEIEALGEGAFYNAGLTGDLVLNKVDDIPDNVFYQNKFTNADLSKCEGLKRIGKMAFYNIKTLGNVVLPGSVEELGDQAFSACATMKEINLPPTLDKIGTDAFGGCWELSAIQVVDNMQIINNVVIKYVGSSSIDELVIPEGVVAIANSAMTGGYISYITKLTLPEGLKRIGNGNFYSCSKLTSLALPSTLEELGSSFQYATSLKRITLPVNLKTLDATAFKGCKAVNRVTCNARNLEVINGTSGMFSEFANLVTFIFGNEVENIPSYLCAGLKEIEKIDLPASLKRIGAHAFQGSTKMGGVTLPEGLEEIGDYAFDGCTGLNLDEMQLPSTLVTIGSYAFNGQGSTLTSLELPSSLKTIGKRAFTGCSNMTSLTLNEGLDSIGDYAFYGCNSLTSLTLPSSLTRLGKYAFMGCTSLESLEMGDNLGEIPSNAFNNCPKLASLTLGAGITKIGGRAFLGCTALETLHLDEALTLIGDSAFYNSQSLSSLTIPNKVTELRPFSFYRSTIINKFTSLSLGRGMEKIGKDAFYTLNQLTSLISLAIVPPTFEKTPGSNFTTCKLRVPSQAIEAYKAHEYWGKYTNIIPAEWTGDVKLSIEGGIVRKGLVTPVAVSMTNAIDVTSLACDIVLPEGLSLARDDKGAYAVTLAGRTNDTFTVTATDKDGDVHLEVTTTGDAPMTGDKGTILFLPLIADEGLEGETTLDIIINNVSLTSLGLVCDDAAAQVTVMGRSVIAVETPGTLQELVEASAGTVNELVVTGTINGKDLAFMRSTHAALKSMIAIDLTDAQIVAGDETVYCRVFSSSSYPYHGAYNFVYDTNCRVEGGTVYTDDLSGLFYNMDQLREVRLPKGESSIGMFMCSGCRALEKIVVQEDIDTIGAHAFASCSLLSWTVPATVKKLGDYAFSGCSAMTGSLVLPNVCWIGESSLRSTGIETLDLSGAQELKEIGAYAFYYDNKLTTVLFPQGLEKIGTSAFSYCTLLSQANLPASCLRLGSGVFYNTAIVPERVGDLDVINNVVVAYKGNSNATRLEIPDGILAIADNALNVTSPSLVTSITLPEGLRHIGNSVCNGFKNITSITLPSTLETLGASFTNSSVTEVTLPRSLVEIDGAFASSMSLKKVTIPEGVRYMGSSTFSGSSNLTDVVYNAPLECCEVNWKNFGKLERFTIGGSNVSIPNNFFNGMKTLVKVNLPDALQEIGSHAFYNCQALENVYIPSSVTSIGEWAFYGCKAFTDIQLPGKLETLGRAAFNGACDNITSLTIPASLKAIGPRAFFNCKALVNLELHDGLEEIGDSAFTNCNSLVCFTLPQGLTTIGDLAFSGCNVMDTLAIPASVTRIGKEAFRNCNALDSLTIPDGVKEIGPLAFYGCSKMTRLTLGSGLEKIGYAAFSQCTSLSEVRSLATTPPTMTSIYLSDDNFPFYRFPTTAQLLVPKGCVENYKAAKGWNQFKNIDVIPDPRFTDKVQLSIESKRLRSSDVNMLAVEMTNDITVTSLAMDIVMPSGLTLAANEIKLGSRAADTHTITATVQDGMAHIEVTSSTGAAIGGNDGVLFLLPVIVGEDVDDGDTFTITTNGIELNDGKKVCNDIEATTTVFVPITIAINVTTPGTLQSLLEARMEESGQYKLNELVVTGRINGNDIMYMRSTQDFKLQVLNLSGVEIVEDGTVYFYIPNSYNPIMFTDYDTDGYYYIYSHDRRVVSEPNYHSYDIRGYNHYIYTDDYSMMFNPHKSSVQSQGMETVREIRMPQDTITILGNGAFKGCGALETLVMSQELVEYGDEAFSGCSNLVMKINPKARRIGTSAFKNCTSLPGDLVLDGVEEIGKDAFSESSLETVKISSGKMKELSAFTSSNTTKLSLRSIDLSGATALEKIGGFRYNEKLERVVLPDGVIEIENEAFYNCSLLADIDIPSTVAIIGSYAFYGTKVRLETSGDFQMLGNVIMAYKGSKDITELVIPEGVQSISDDVFYNLPVKKLVLPQSLISTGNNFDSFTSLKSVMLPAGLETLGGFQNCTALEEITIPRNVKLLYNTTFQNSGLISVTYNAIDASVFDATVTNSRAMDLASCSNLRTLTFGDEVETIPARMCTGLSKVKSITLPASIRKIESGAFSELSIITTLDLPQSLEVVENSAFYSCSNLESVTFNGDLVKIGEDAFRWCEALTSVTFNGNVDKIEKEAFYETNIEQLKFSGTAREIGEGAFNRAVKNLKSLALPQGLEIVGKQAFADCESLETLVLPSTLKSIGYQAFSSCNSLDEINLPDGIEYMGYSVFSGCTAVKSLTIPSSFKEIPEGTFSGCNSLEELVLPEGLESIGSDAFSGCNVLKELNLPASLKSMGSYAFSDCYKLLSLTLPQQLTEVPSKAFYNCNSLAELKLNNGITIIGKEAFYGCNALFDLTIPNSVVYIGESAFIGAKALTTLTLGRSVRRIYDNAFYSCSNLREINSLNPEPPTFDRKSYYPFYTTNKAECVLRVPEEAVTNYKTANYWSEFTRIEALNDEMSSNCRMAIDATSLRKGCVNLVPVTLTNDIDVVSFYCDLVLPSGLSLAKDSQGEYEVTLGDRGDKTHSIVAKDLNGSIRIVNYSGNNNAFKGNDGTLFYLPIVVNDNIKPGADVVVRIAGIYLTKKEGLKEVTCPTVISMLEVQPAYGGDGDVNGDGHISIADVSMAVEFALGRTVEGGNKDAADVNNDGRVSAADVSIIVSYVLAGKNPASVKAKVQAVKENASEDVLHTATTPADNNGNWIALGVTHQDECMGVQMDICLPRDARVAAVRMANGNDAQVVLWNTISNGRVRVLAYSPSGKTFVGADALIEVLVEDAHDDIAVDNTLMTVREEGCIKERAANGLTISLNDETTGVAAAGNAGNTGHPVTISTLAGHSRTVRNGEAVKLAPGVYIIDGKKVTIK